MTPWQGPWGSQRFAGGGIWRGGLWRSEWPPNEGPAEWLLLTGQWADNGIWDDTGVWNDG